MYITDAAIDVLVNKERFKIIYCIRVQLVQDVGVTATGISRFGGRT